MKHEIINNNISYIWIITAVFIEMTDTLTKEKEAI